MKIKSGIRRKSRRRPKPLGFICDSLATGSLPVGEVAPQRFLGKNRKSGHEGWGTGDSFGCPILKKFPD
jgi:hypothetical protein